jgi:hypothetical protein
MKRLLALGFLLIVLLSNASADPEPARSWVAGPCHVSVSLVLHGNWIDIRIRNDSKVAKVLFAPRMTIHLAYIDDKGKRVFLGEKGREENPESYGGPSKWNLPPGELGETMGISLDADEMALIKTHSVVFITSIGDPETASVVAYESQPKLLQPIK